jgi:serine/threonine protein kinase
VGPSDQREGPSYRITRLLGRGGMGAVFAAQHEMLGEEVAIKLMLAEAMRGPEAVKRFVNEARAAAKIRGEHVVRVLDVGVLDDGRPYISMELMEGEDLGQAATARTSPGATSRGGCKTSSSWGRRNRPSRAASRRDR